MALEERSRHSIRRRPNETLTLQPFRNHLPALEWELGGAISIIKLR